MWEDSNLRASHRGCNYARNKKSEFGWSAV
jgi:hypothetical protein